MKNFFRNLFGTSIKSKVMAVIEARIESAQRLYDIEVKALKGSKKDQKVQAVKDFDTKIKDINDTHENKKAVLVDRHVDNILSKLL